MSHPQGEKKPLFQAQISAAQLGMDSAQSRLRKVLAFDYKPLDIFIHITWHLLLSHHKTIHSKDQTLFPLLLIYAFLLNLAEGENGPWRSTQWFDDTPLSLFMWSSMIFPLLCCSVCALSLSVSFIHKRVPVDTMIGFVSMAEKAWQWIDRLKGSCDVHTDISA